MSTSSPTINPQNLQSFNQPEFQDLVQQFLLAASYRGLSPQTLTYYSFHLLGLERFLISRQIPFLATNCVMVLQDWLQQLTKQGYAGRSIRGRFLYLSAISSIRISGYSWRKLLRNHAFEFTGQPIRTNLLHGSGRGTHSSSTKSPSIHWTTGLHHDAVVAGYRYSAYRIKRPAYF